MTGHARTIHKYISMALTLGASLLLVACGGGSAGANAASVAAAAVVASSSSSSSSGGSSSSSSSSSSSGSSSGASGGTSPAAALARKLGRPGRFLVGLGGQGDADPIAAAQSQSLKPDIFDEYLVGVGASDWTTWNSPKGAYVGVVGAKADSVGAVPMYTLYQMAANGDGNLSGLASATFMSAYWANVKLMYQMIGSYGKPALVNLEPDFWGYSEQQSTNSDPGTLFAYVNTNPDCATLPNNVIGVAACLLQMARQYAPLAMVGFPPSSWGGNTTTDVVTFMNQVGAQHADFIVAQTLDRDAGCIEAQAVAASCVRSGTGWYWDASNQTHPNFQDHLAMIQQYHSGIGNLPVIWWQTPLGLPSSTPGGTDYHYRDNRVQYFLTHASDLVAAGGLGAVFGAGESHQTNITTDGGQFQSLSNAYLAAPVSLP